MYIVILDYEIQQAASKLISDGLEASDICSRFNMKREEHRDGYRRIIISGPGQSRCDHPKEGIWIYTYNEYSRVLVNPFWNRIVPLLAELNEDKYFEHANPEFPTNLIRYVELSICAWETWWDIFEREHEKC